PPTLLAAQLLEAGATPWITLACRDRNRVVLEQELHGLRHVGVRTVLCVTGDGRGYDVRPDVTQVFDLDGPRLAALATATGLTAAVAETPLAPPRALRPRRLVQKQAAGAQVAVLNHVSSTAELRTFVDAARGAGLRIPVVASVAVFTDARSAAVLDALPGLHLDPATVAEVLDADDRVEAGIAVAVRAAQEVLTIDGVDGVNLSGSAATGGPQVGAQIKAEIGRRLGES
ncbi:methylenetetrahydrofolate reductase, partial [uncultured Jatrophihabitans sp.]|uniref:methylenetetrahydrofolate reductase n=1 Tax=uncultured Jatrophihabitans sp. TaxID=1610747 RepID=UPI0035CA1A05